MNARRLLLACCAASLIVPVQAAVAQDTQQRPLPVPLSAALLDCVAAFDNRDQTGPVAGCGFEARESCRWFAYLFNNPTPALARCARNERSYWQDIKSVAASRIEAGPDVAPVGFVAEVNAWWSDAPTAHDEYVYEDIDVTYPQSSAVLGLQRDAVIVHLIARRMDDIYCADASNTYQRVSRCKD